MQRNLKIFSNKKGIRTIDALGTLFFLLVMGIVVISSWSELRNIFFGSNTNFFLRICVMALPAFFLLGVFYNFIQRLRGER